ncbi:MAG TPA: HAD family phosphatase [candidate division Zixibacteria bacterium]|nr:HAD family phosphatase [candidate division Zixibacteria bacterium]
MLRAVIFDFNGVIVDDEPVHFELFREILGEEGIELTKERYYERYLGFDDRGAFAAAFRDHGRLLGGAELEGLVERKAARYRAAIRDRVVLFPGVRSLVEHLARRLPLAVASGALRHEIEGILAGTGLRDYFSAIASAEDVERGKPDPEIFLAALASLNRRLEGAPILAADCVVIEDSREGVRGALRAGMKCVAVTNSHPASALAEAHAVVESLEKVDLRFLERVASDP